MFEFLKPQRMAQNSGRAGVFVILFDASGSMSGLMPDAQRAADVARKSMPTSRMFAFGARVAEVPPGRDFPDIGAGWTDMANALAAISPLSPTRTVLISDGYADNHTTAIEAARTISGAIDTIWCYGAGDNAETDFGRRTLLEISCGGRGRHFDLGPGSQHRTLEQIFQQSIVTVLTGTVYHHHYRPSEHVHHGAPGQQSIGGSAPQITVSRSPSQPARLKW
jgi:hypothetical protein